MEKEEIKKYKFYFYTKTYGRRNPNAKIHFIRHSDSKIMCTSKEGLNGYEFGDSLIDINIHENKVFYSSYNRTYYMIIPTSIDWCCKKCIEAVLKEGLTY